MKSRVFSLKPFPSAAPSPHLDIRGNIRRNSNKLSIRYTLSGPLTLLMIPEFADIPLRRIRLWENTCFEFFLAPSNSDHYWEFNLSTSGHWNVYRFTSCREGMREETAFTALPFSVLLYSDSLQLSLDVDLDRLVPADQSLKIGINAVTKATNGGITFWSLTHPGARPDFHRRDTFVVDL